MSDINHIWQDSPTAIWNDLKPQTIYLPFSALYPAFGMIALFLVVHFLMDKLMLSKASNYARSQTKMSPPKWIKSSEYASQLTYEKISSIPSKKFAKSMKKFDLSASKQQELISYQKKCNEYSKNVSKYLEAAFKVIVFGCVYFYGLGLLYVDAPWFWDQRLMWARTRQNYFKGLVPQEPGNNAYFNLNIYYFLQIGNHGHRAIYQFFEHSRKDWLAMFVHHWVATFLLMGSMLAGYQQIGATVLLCNDNLDLLMPLAKLSEYTGHTTLQSIFTISFCLLWIPFRIGLYFYKVMYSIVFDGGYFVLRPYIWHWMFLSGLSIIYFLQFIWTRYLLQMVWRKLFEGKGIVDVRSASDNDDDDNNKKTQ